MTPRTVAAQVSYLGTSQPELDIDLDRLAREHKSALIAVTQDLREPQQVQRLYSPFDSTMAAQSFMALGARIVVGHDAQIGCGARFNGASEVAYKADTAVGGYLVINGVSQHVPGLDVRAFPETGLRFKEPHGVHPRPHGVAIDKAVLHWTASERDGPEGAAAVLRNMSKRTDAGCHLLITNDGVVWQFADLVTDMTSHVSHRAVRRASVGIEVSGYGWMKRAASIPEAGEARERYEARIHGWQATFANYYPAQQEAVHKLADALEQHMAIPGQVMTSPWAVRSNRDLKRHQGWLGHLHCATKKAHPKVDPGTAPLEALARYCVVPF